MYEQKGDNMTIITTVELALGKLRLFRRVRTLETKQETTEKTVAALMRYGYTRGEIARALGQMTKE